MQSFSASLCRARRARRHVRDAPVDGGPFDTRRLMDDPYVLLVRPELPPLAGAKNPPSLKEIAAIPLIGYRQCRSIHAVEERFRGTGLEPQIVFRSDDNTTIQGMVAAGVGSALVPRLTVETRDDTVVGLPVDPRVPPRRSASPGTRSATTRRRPAPSWRSPTGSARSSRPSSRAGPLSSPRSRRRARRGRRGRESALPWRRTPTG